MSYRGELAWSLLVILAAASGLRGEQPTRPEPAAFLSSAKTHQDLVNYFHKSYDWRALNILLARAGKTTQISRVKAAASMMQQRPHLTHRLLARMGVIRDEQTHLKAKKTSWETQFGQEALAIETRDYLILGTRTYKVFASTAGPYMQKILAAYEQIHPFPETRQGKLVIKIYPGQKVYDAQDYVAGSNATFRPAEHVLAVWVDTKLAARSQEKALAKMLHLLFHEAFHGYMHYRVPHQPMWLAEGTAEVMEATQIRSKAVYSGSDAIHADNLRILKHFLASNKTYKLRDFVQLDMIQYKRNRHVAYTQGWGFVHFLLYAEEGKYRRHYEDVIVYLRNGLSTEDAVKSAFATLDWDKLQENWEAYIHSLKPGEQKDRILLQSDWSE